MQTTRRFTRLALLLLAAAMLGGCCFHGCGHWHGSYYPPTRHCR